jgi:ceramide glucosyltransferase
MTLIVAGLLFGFLAVIETIITTAQALLVRRFRSAPLRLVVRPSSRHVDSLLSILKPVCGLDDELEENLVSFTRIRGVRHEVIVSAEDPDDPALEVVRRVMRRHPHAPFRIIVDGGSRGGVVNRKVERLIAALRLAKGDILLISDSNVRIAPDDIAVTLAAFDDARVGCVSNLFTGAGARSFGASIESLHLLSFVVTGAVIAARAGVPCVVGKSMAIRRDVLAAIGGFERFRCVLAEDQAIGLAVKEAGFAVVLSRVVVRNVIVRRTLKRAVDRQVRWNKIRYAFSHRLHAAELLLNPLLFALVAALLAPMQLALLPALVLIARWIQMALLRRAMEADVSRRQLALAPVLDVAMLYAWCAPFFSSSVTWRGHRARIGRDTELIAA